MDRALTRLLLAVLGLVLAVVWLLAGIVPFAAPAWVPPSGLTALALATLL